MSRLGTSSPGGLRPPPSAAAHSTDGQMVEAGASSKDAQHEVIKMGDIVILSTDECGMSWIGGSSVGRLETDGFNDGGCWAREGATGGDTLVDSLFRITVKQVGVRPASHRHRNAPLGTPPQAPLCSQSIPSLWDCMGWQQKHPGICIL